MKKIANIIKSASHIDYTAQVINPIDRSGVLPTDYALGNFVLIGKNTVGLIYDTELFNPSLILSSQKEQIEIYAPDLRDEVDILLKILLLGIIENNHGDQNLPSQVLEAGSDIWLMEKNMIKDFHCSPEGHFQVKYLSNLNSYGNKLNPSLFSLIVKQLNNLLKTEEIQILEIIEQNLLWNKMINTQV
jgi:hypothetical protein